MCQPFSIPAINFITSIDCNIFQAIAALHEGSKSVAPSKSKERMKVSSKMVEESAFLDI